MLIYCYHQYITATALLHARQIPTRINKEKKWHPQDGRATQQETEKKGKRPNRSTFFKSHSGDFHNNFHCMLWDRMNHVSLVLSLPLSGHDIV